MYVFVTFDDTFKLGTRYLVVVIWLSQTHELVNSFHTLPIHTGAIGGSIWHGIKGARNSPGGARLAGSMYAIKARAPVLGGKLIYYYYCLY